MSGHIEKNLSAQGYAIPAAPPAVASYDPVMISRGWLYVSGQLPMKDGQLAYRGQLGRDSDLAAAKEAAALCALNILAQANAALDGLERLRRCIRLGGFVNAASDFEDHPAVLDGASELVRLVFGADGGHCRAAVGCSSLPRGALVEVDAIFEIDGND